MIRWGSLCVLGLVAAFLVGCNAQEDAVSSRVEQLRLMLGGRQYAALPSSPQAATDCPAADPDLQMLNETLLAVGSSSAPATCPAREESIGEPGSVHPSEINWRYRHGPAHPGDVWGSFGVWAKELPATAWDDTVAVAKDPVAWIGFAAAGASGIVINASGSDDRVARHYEKRGHQLNPFWDAVGDIGGNPGTHFAIAGALYFDALARNDSVNYEKATTMINALAVNGMVTLALKGIVRTRSPNGDPFGWPSGHTSSSFAFATVAYEQYGPWVGIPLYAFASYVGYERIDARNHDFSDVISGAILGTVIGHVISQNHMPRIAGFEVMPYVCPSNDSFGVMLCKRW
jgi:hypothetical protein